VIVSRGHPLTVDEPLAKRAASAGPPPANGKHRYKLGPHSRILARGAIGNMNGNSVEAKFIKTIEAGLIAHLGGKASIAQQLLIRRVSRAMLRLEMLDDKELLTEHDFRLASSLDSRVRLGLKLLGLERAEVAPPSLEEALAAGRRS
jgi:hypothetical protein